MLRTRSTQRTLRSILESRLVFILLLGLAAFFLVGIGREVFRRYSLDQQFSDLQQTIAELEQQNNELTGQISYFQSDTYQEEQARLKLGYTEPGESAVTVPVQLDGNAATSAAVQQTVSTAESSLTQWIHYFFSHPSS